MSVYAPEFSEAVLSYGNTTRTRQKRLGFPGAVMSMSCWTPLDGAVRSEIWTNHELLIRLGAYDLVVHATGRTGAKIVGVGRNLSQIEDGGEAEGNPRYHCSLKANNRPSGLPRSN